MFADMKSFCFFTLSSVLLEKDLWTSLTQSEKVASCPGECIHAITSIFCDRVLEDIPCGQPFLRCCVPNDLSYGTPVETSPPLGHDIDRIYALTDAPHSLTATVATTVTTTAATHPAAVLKDPFSQPIFPVKTYKISSEAENDDEVDDMSSVSESTSTDPLMDFNESTTDISLNSEGDSPPLHDHLLNSLADI